MLFQKSSTINVNKELKDGVAVIASQECTMTLIIYPAGSRDQVVDELILCFTHDTEIPYMLAGIAPTGKYVEIPHVVVMKFKGNRIVHEHIYWDQASVLAQIGLLDCTKLPITGIEQSKKLQEISSPKKK